ncbi:uncharacterized protein LOC105212773 [Zeugodacus cucurbitae]|uniref:Ribosome-recycling factor n=1 Tax=Zeugodacus cucurbitae TaxID=28588 RepID=A0A0A1XBN3_ZEUCU|nr:uncharacterized protein LOC105212773 [Zeugodacus cucurbitae]
MDYMFADLLTREELLNILIERQLNLPNIQEMSHGELVRLYKTFALPLARRERHRVRGKLECNNSNAQHLKINNVISMDTDEPEYTPPSHQISQTSNSSTTENSITCGKRLCGYKHLHPLTDEYLSIATKRIKIAWS